MSNRYCPQESTPEEVSMAARTAAWASMNLDPETTATTGRNIPGIRRYIVDESEQAFGKPLPGRSIELIGHAFKNIHDAYEATGFFGKQSVEDRLALVTDPGTILAISSLANRSETAIGPAIANYPGGQPLMKLSYDETHLVAPEKTHASPESPRCPYAKDPQNERDPHNLMKTFAPWAGQVAVHLTELYRRK